MPNYAQHVLKALGSNISLEDNTVDPNDVKIPAIENEEVENEDFTLEVQPEVATANIGTDGHEVDTVVKEHIAEINNIKQETGGIISAQKALDTIAVEMRKVIEENGKLSHDEIYVANESLKLMGCAPLDISLESMNTAGMLRVGTEVTMEGIISGILTLVNKAANAAMRALNATTSLVKELTPLIDRRLTAAMKLSDEIETGKREDVDSEISGKWIKYLAVDGKLPEPKTTIETLNLMVKANAEITGVETFNEITTRVKEGVDEMHRIIREDFKGYNKPNGWLSLAVIFGGTAAASALVALSPSSIAAFGTLNVLTNGVKDGLKLHKQIKVPKDLFPDTGKLFPTSAKIHFSNEGTYSLYHSQPLFGNKAYFTSTMNTTLEIPDTGLNVDDYNVSLWVDTLDKTPMSKETKIAALSSSEQRKVIDKVIGGLYAAREWYKGYGARSKKISDMLADCDKTAANMHKVARAESKSYSGYIMRGIVTGMSRNFSDGIWSGQAEVMSYSTKTFGALIDYVQASSKVTSKTESNESYSVEDSLEYRNNPFM